jgi:hypothetical protein
MTIQNSIMAAMNEVIILRQEFLENPSLEAKNQVKMAEWYVAFLHAQEDDV